MRDLALLKITKRKLKGFLIPCAALSRTILSYQNEHPDALSQGATICGAAPTAM